MLYRFYDCNYCAKRYDTKDELLNHLSKTFTTGCNSTMLEKKTHKEKKEESIKFVIVSRVAADLDGLKEGEMGLYKSNIIRRMRGFLTHIGYYNPITKKMEVR